MTGALTGALAVGLLVLTACTPAATDPEATTAAGPTGEPTTEAPDPALAAACVEFYGDPEYAAPVSRVVLDRAATAPEAGPSDPFFYAMTGDEVEDAFDGAPAPAGQAATALADWFRSQPEQGQDADRDAFRAAWEGLAGQCASVSEAARWIAEPGEDGTKSAALVCAGVFDTPGTLTHFGNANVLTSNMFKLVGRSPQQVPADRMDDVQATADLLGTEIARVDDDAVRTALEQVRAPFADALAGDMWSEGLQDPLTALGAACDSAGYRAPEGGELGGDPTDEDEDGGLV